VTRLLAGYNRGDSLIPSREKRFLSLLHSIYVVRFQGIPRASYFKGYQGLGIKWMRREADRSPHLVARLRMSGAILPLIICPCGMHWDNSGEGDCKYINWIKVDQDFG
jgi:hypothetical protein